MECQRDGEVGWGVGRGVRRERGEGAVTGEDVPKRSLLISGGVGGVERWYVRSGDTREKRRGKV